MSIKTTSIVSNQMPELVLSVGGLSSFVWLACFQPDSSYRWLIFTLRQYELSALLCLFIYAACFLRGRHRENHVDGSLFRMQTYSAALIASPSILAAVVANCYYAPYWGQRGLLLVAIRVTGLVAVHLYMLFWCFMIAVHFARGESAVGGFLRGLAACVLATLPANVVHQNILLNMGGPSYVNMMGLWTIGNVAIATVSLWGTVRSRRTQLE